MIYKSFKINNFKGVDEVSVDLANNRIITLVGLNESGKTSVMESITWFYKMIKGFDPTEQDLKGFRPKGTAFTGTISISSTLILDNEDKKRIQEFWKKDLEKRTTLEIGDIFTYTYSFQYEKHNWQKTERNVAFKIKTTSANGDLSRKDNNNWQKLIAFIRKSIVPEILYYDDFILGIPDSIIFNETSTGVDDQANEKNDSSIVWKLAINDILKSVDERFDFQEDVVDILDSDPDAATQRISEMENALNTKITERWSELFGKNKVNFKEIKLDNKPLEGGLELSFKIKTKANKIFNVNERSKGFQWFFSFLLFTEFRKKRTKNILFLLDEPASNLHSTAQIHILNALEELSHDSLVIYSTHSHHLINPKWLSGAYICINENNSGEVLQGGLNDLEGAKIYTVSYYHYVGQGYGSDKISYFQPILDSLDYRPSTVEPVPEIVILEGKNDWYTFNYFSECILKDKNKINFYPGAGCNKLDDIIRLYLSWGKNFIVLLDGDTGGLRAQTRYNKDFGPALKNRVFTLKDIFNKEWETEDLIGVMNQRLIHDDVYGSGSYDITKSSNPQSLKSNLNYAINQLQFEKKELIMNNGTKDNFRKVITFVLEKLKQANTSK